jgi:sulfur-oxidizing protein SoxY
MRRRAFLTKGGAVLAALAASGLLRPGAHAQTWNKTAFEVKNLQELVRALGGQDAAQSGEITLIAPEIAENGAVVPVGVTANLSNVESIAILVEKNPNVLAAIFEIPAGTVPELQTRVKMAQTSNVFALAKADGKFYFASREIKVTLGGCGG